MRPPHKKLPYGIQYIALAKQREGIMKSFRNYAKTTQTTQTQQTANTQQPQDEQTVKSAEELTQSIASAYHGKSSAEMLKNVLTEAEKSKRAGTLSNEEIDNFYQSFAPMLDPIQRKKLRAIVEKLKEI